MSTDIYGQFRGVVLGKMDEEQMFNVEIPEDYDDYNFNHPEYKKVESAMWEVLGGTEEDDYQGIDAELKRLTDELAERAVELIKQRLESNSVNSFDPMI